MLFPYSTRMVHNLPYIKKIIVASFSTVKYVAQNVVFKHVIPNYFDNYKDALVVVKVNNKIVSHKTIAENYDKTIYEVFEKNLIAVKEQYPEASVTGICQAPTWILESKVIGESGAQSD